MRNDNNSIEFSSQIQNMFTAIAPRYDLLNRFLSMGLDRYWRKVAVDYLAPEANERIIDIATGTGDMLLEIVSRNNLLKVFGIDFSWQMLALGRSKAIKKGYGSDMLSHRIITIALLIGIILGYILGHLVPVR